MVSKRLLFVAAAALLLALSQALPVAEQAEAASAERTNERQLSHNCPSSFNPVQCTIWVRARVLCATACAEYAGWAVGACHMTRACACHLTHPLR